MDIFDTINTQATAMRLPLYADIGNLAERVIARVRAHFDAPEAGRRGGIE